MRTFQILDQVSNDDTTGILSLKDSSATSHIDLRREGEYIAISASYGPIEIAIRPRLQEVVRVLSHLQPVEGLQTSRQVGSGQVNIAMGLQSDGRLVIRPMLIGDASGHISLNFTLTSSVREVLVKWLGA